MTYKKRDEDKSHTQNNFTRHFVKPFQEALISVKL